MAFPIYGVGILAATPPGAVATPVRASIFREGSLDVKLEQDILQGENLDPEDVATKSRVVSGKAKCSGFASDLFAIMAGLSASPGGFDVVPDEAGTIPSPSGPYTITVAGSATWERNLGVINQTTGLAMTRVASGPTAGQYSVAAGVYTFAAADAGANVLISYSKTNALAKTIDVVAQKAGSTPTFTIDWYNTYRAGSVGFRFTKVVPDGASMSFGLKHGEWDFSWTAFRDPLLNSVGKVVFVGG